MALTSTAHLNFRGNARAALEFYHSVFGGHLMIATYRQVGVPRDAPDGGQAGFAPVAADSPDVDRVAFGVVAGPNGFRVAAYDVYGADGGGMAGTSPNTAHRTAGLTHDEAVFLVLNGDSYDELTGPWTALSDGGHVIAALSPPRSDAPSYGMVTDRFGLTWIFGVDPGAAT